MTKSKILSKDYIKYVNIKQGTSSNERFSNGNTLPLVQLPFGFSSFSVQTNSHRGNWFYHPDDKSFEGIRITHQPSPWIGDRGAILFTPQSEQAYSDFDSIWSGYEEIEMKPHYIKLYAKRPSCMIELTPTMYGAAIRMNFKDDTSNYLSILAPDGDIEYKYSSEENSVYCSSNANSLKGSESDKLKIYNIFQFKEEDVDLKSAQDGHIKLKKKNIEFYIASSYISYEQAKFNLDTTNFDELKTKNEITWNEKLGKIEINESDNIMKTFYSCMYRVFLFPHRAYETDKNGNILHFAPSINKVVSGVRYTDNGFWDTYRTIYPLFSLIAKNEYKEILEGYINEYLDSGYLPCWTAIDAKKCMPSTMIDAVIADAASKGILSGEPLKTAYEAMIKHANKNSTVPEYGREGCEDYLKLGYVPFDKYGESVNLTLDASYGDYCIAQVAEILGLNEDKEKYLKRSENYKNIFDFNSGFMRARDTNGNFRENFNPFSWGYDYTEASAWQTSFAVQHDFDGLAKLYGGKENLLKKLDELFETPPIYKVGGYKKEIHEMTEFAVGNWGQCAICNQPSFHLPFIYAHFGENKKTEYWANKICKEAFSYHDDGFPGDEDNGSMAAWYIFASIGMYPLTPGKDKYVKFNGIISDYKINDN